MSEKFTKIQSIQNGDFTPTQNRVDFYIPESMGVVSLRDTFVEIQMTPTVNDQNPATGAGIYPLTMKWTLDSTASPPVPIDNHFPNVAVVRNAYLSGERVGQIENVRRVDILRSNLYDYRKPPMGMVSDNYLNASQLNDPIDGTRKGIFTQLNKSGTRKSIYNAESALMISLADILDFGGVEALDLSKTGDLRLHLELNLKNIAPFAITPIANATQNAALIANLAGGPGGNTPQSIQTTTKYPTLASSPFHVGQKVVLAGTNAGAGDDLAFTGVIASIAPQADGSLIIGFGQDLVVIPANETVTGITIQDVAPAQPTMEYTQAQVVVKQLALDPKEVPSVYQYYVFQTEETNGNNVVNYSNGFEIDGSATEVLVMPVSAANQLSATGNATEYFRMRLNNVDLTDREVYLRSPLYYDRLATTLDGIGYDLRNLNENSGAVDVDTSGMYGVAAYDNEIWASPLGQTTQRKLLQLNVKSAGLNAFNIYSKLPRVLSL